MNIIGLDRLYKKFNALDNVMQDNIARCVETQAKRVQAEAKLMCPVNEGELRESIRSSAEKTEYGAVGKVYTNKSYAAYVEFGTGPTGQENHEGISPNVSVAYSQKGWTYMGDDGEWVHTKGQAAQPYMYLALKNYEDKVTTNLKANLKAAIKKGL